MLKKLLLAASVSAAFAVATPVMAAQIVTFDPYGNGGVTSIPIDTLDWAPGSAYAQGGNDLPIGGTALSPPADAKTFQLFASGSLSAPQLGGNSYPADLALPAGAFPQITFVGSFTELGWQTSPGAAQFQFAGAPVLSSLNFFEIWAGGVAKNDLTGAGFNDGTLLFRGHGVAASGNFGAVQAANVPLDQTADLNQWGAQNTVTGSGGSKLTVEADFVNLLYFPLGLSEIFLSLFDTQNNLAFTGGNNPTTCFVSDFGGTGASSCDATAFNVDGTAVNSDGTLGTINGAPIGLGGGDSIIFRSDASQSFLAVPEPGSMALFGLSLTSLAFLSRRRKEKQQ